MFRRLVSTASSTSVSNLAIATKQQLYMVDASSPGSVFFLPHGTRIFNKLVHFMKIQQEKHGFTEVISPLMYKKDLWETSGHWDNYADDMFRVESNSGSNKLEAVYGLKPMNCPGHCVIFRRFARSHHELPIRLSDWSSLHRNEPSGALTGLTRVRRFHQDDGHIFCSKSQVGAEIGKTLQLIRLCYSVFGFQKYRMMLSTRPETHIGTVEEWDEAESELQKALDTHAGPENWDIRDKDGAFYGPKIDVLVTDRTGKEHQAATVQLDFQLPQRFQLEYQGERGPETPIMVHRAVFGSVERFMALLMDEYEGKWPFWLSPRQAVIIPVNETHLEYSRGIQEKLGGQQDLDVASSLRDVNYYVDVDFRAETVGLRTKDAIQKGYNYIILVGDREVQSGKVAVRSRDSRKVQTMDIDELQAVFADLEKSYK
ncbi:hypothetical protein KL935_000151 [Ogataea polymorpha]|uniref:threonine--tRNA ligase n=1 Tax=Ogataea polymorpha TaxID=460523 RepID=A0A9P8P410_9ASCO|nr:hypothetical protein KL937_000397 [Ogataea polymorpha]KAG7895911.1 hypothetical protein KL936_000619 [Ogataea polymorpha]KAG7896212.1 hypothetical protein KL908_000726 [Ogataea polymorpha]KAG7904012.1 hypothetical protein KL935_000151 [Ogataea polymorpha]KAG7908783.1 hypothetical protein KL906_003014 [Ogataea polymorpha]